jgi:hypothetical protein
MPEMGTMGICEFHNCEAIDPENGNDACDNL